MISIRTSFALAGTLLLVSTNTLAKLDDFKDGTVIKGFGKYAPVATATVDKKTKMKVAFDVAAQADAGKVNRKFDSLARFINMQVAAGVPKENIQLALVVHGKASFDLLNNPSYQKLHEQDNPNKPLLQALMENGVRVILCGQTGVAYDIELSQLVKGSEVELSAMTAHALLQQDGYTVNPF
ncbi:MULTISPECIES: DsrE family protein [Alteromonadaceae]|uniref:DsrE family protein n=1 Tax=Brumicola blandensis TaxID=3075611 RepID=A0AAW8R2D7_9ALTE|nr:MULTISPECIES: DsrE family protein [unclassified Alteromonas]MDT0583451.1 DsrE family protein [Alteromonas sp. W409]MDT0629386.1 DsrE family protein [Alteromonas sp. W364]